jgi:NTE family protein
VPGPAPLDADASPPTDWTRQLVRVLDIVTEQTRALRRRRLMQEFKQEHEEGLADRAQPQKKKGTYWGIRTSIDKYGVSTPLIQDNATTRELQHIRTRLNEFKPKEQGQLINWGYALADAGMRKYVDTANAAAGTWPVPEFALDL